jgi:betaine-aldehyde dehydrogenase
MLGNFYTQGEVCTNCTRVYVHKSVYQAFVDELKTRIENNIIAGDPLDPNVNLGALISKKHQDLVMGYINKGTEEGATLLTGGTTLSPESAPNGYFVAPTVFTDCSDEMTIVKEEIFGPVMSLLVFDGNSPAEMPVGGYKQSGIGRENGIETLDHYTQTKSIYVGMTDIESPF